MSERSDSCSVLHIVASLQGGAGRHVFLLAQALRDLGHTAVIAAPEDHPGLQKQIHQHELPFLPLPGSPRNPLLPLWRLNRMLARSSYSHIHVHGHRAAFLTRLALPPRDRTPLIYTVHGYHPPFYVNPFSRWWVNRLERALAPRTDAFICVSESTRTLLAHAVPTAWNKAVIIPNGIALTHDSPAQRDALRTRCRRQFSLPPETYVFGAVSRLQWQKGIDRLLRAFAPLAQTDAALRLLLVGDGPERAHLTALAQELGIASQVVFAGERADARKLYPGMDAFVLPSLWEGLPLTVLEAWDAGVPVIATDVPGSRDLIQDGVNGWLAESSIAGIQQAMQTVRQQRDSLNAQTQQASQTLRERYTLPQMVRQTLELYARIKIS